MASTATCPSNMRVYQFHHPRKFTSRILPLVIENRLYIICDWLKLPRLDSNQNTEIQSLVSYQLDDRANVTRDSRASSHLPS